ncbi:MAG: pilus assembly protein PilQ [Schwartzia sp.]|nr:pilus assembly protein PilQ [Schwartzia sp. (in: firmicutes)]
MSPFFAFLLFLNAEAGAEPVSLHVADGNVSDVLSTVSYIGGINIVVDDSVSGTVSMNLDGVEPEEAVELIAAAKGLSVEQRGDVFVVSTLKSGNSALYRTYTYPINYADLGTVHDAVSMALRKTDRKDSSSSGESKSGEDNRVNERVLVDSGTNTLILYGTAAENEAARRIVGALDQPIQQVSLEAKVVAISKEAAKKLGVEWEWSKIPQYPEYTRDYETRRFTVQNPDGSYRTVTESVPRETAERTWKNGESMPGIIRFGRGPGGHPFEFYYGAQIQALITDGKAKLLARPNITTLQGREAQINIGGEVPVPTVTSTSTSTTTGITYRDAGIILKCTPRVNPEGGITTKVHTEVSSPLYVESLKAYQFQKRSADTVVRLKDGETMVIGGLIGSEESKSLSKVPFLGDLPILGAFFRSVRKSKSDSEIMIFLTAHVLQDGETSGYREKSDT